MSRAYAAQTTVSSENSRAEIERTLARYGADGFGYGWKDGQGAIVSFSISDRQIRFTLELPARDAEEFLYTPAKRERRSPENARKAYDQAVRQKWRALALVIKAKLEAVASEIVEFDQEFMAHIVLPDGQTVGDHALPAMARALEGGEVPPMLPDYSKD